jgi:hypothetical protein
MHGQQAAHQRTGRRAQRDAEGVGRQGAGPLMLGEIVGHQRIGRGHAARLADAHAHAGQEQVREAADEAAQGGEAAPQGQGRGHDPHAAEAVGQPGDRDGQGRVEQGEGQAAHQAELAVGQAELVLDRLGQDAEDLPVQEVEACRRGSAWPGRRSDSARPWVEICLFASLIGVAPRFVLLHKRNGGGPLQQAAAAQSRVDS